MSKKNTKQLFKLFSKFNQRRFPNIVTDGETWAPFFEATENSNGRFQTIHGERFLVAKEPQETH